ncbi:hypothetical protein NM688_g7164 [Phlebia brevispora]|uniref:Uncharacterized protein n=1 Tax=Phlebia brevispora TaxID=194682 RepID=A0ACC1S8L6_9APHY|nr:hypothetical protein NM688_g7164 [Phlebia brevispora]
MSETPLVPSEARARWTRYRKSGQEMAFSSVRMSMAPLDPPRPSMRRKSSAQNLLTSFKSVTTQSSQAASTNGAAGFSYPTSVPTPTTAAPMTREWDVQSLHSDSVASSGLTNGGAAHVQGTTVEILRELVKKRIITLTYLRNVHEGRSHWFHTIMITRGELDRIFSNAAMKGRTYRFACLGMSLANSFDVKDPQDFLRGLTNVLNEYDQSKEEGDRPKMRSLFRSGRPKQRQNGPTDYAITYADPSETSYLVAPHVVRTATVSRPLSLY